MRSLRLLSLGVRAAALTVTAATHLFAQARAIRVDDGGWTGLGPQARVVQLDGRPAISIRNGRVIRRDVRMMDGTLDVDVRLTRVRSFVYVQFRMESDEDHEEFYLRPHKSGLPDAVQYAPVFHGRSTWQLYHGSGGTAAVPLEPGQWTRVRLVLNGRRAALFVGDTTKPVVVVPRLAREPREGYIALRSFLPAGVEAPEDPAVFSQLVVRPGVIAYDFANVPDVAAAPGSIMRWEVAGAYDPGTARAGTLPPGFDSFAWRQLDSEPNGLLMLTRYLTPPTGARRWATAVRLRLRSDREQTVPLELGFSDALTLFVNGRPILSGDARYSFDNPRQEGVIGLWQATAFLPLRMGENEVVLIVSDVFGGWGVMGRIPPEVAGVEPRSD